MPFLASAALFMVLLVAVTAFTISNESMSFFVHADWGKGGYDGSHYSRMLAQENNGNNVHNFIGATVDIAGTRVSIKLARCRKFQLTIICTNIFQDEDAPGCLELTDSDEVVLVYDGDELADSTVARPDPWLLDTAANGDC